MISPKTKVLIVDDFQLIRKIIRDSLAEIEFHEVVEAANGEEAMSILKQEYQNSSPVGLMFLDWNMPGKNGMDVLKFCRSSEEFKNLPIMMVTAEGEKRQVLSAFTEGATDYIVKPCSKDIVQQKILNLIERLSKVS